MRMPSESKPFATVWEKVSTPAVLLLLVLTPLLLYASYCTIVRAQTSVLDWADESDETTREFRRFCDQFDVPEILIFGWDSANWDDPRFSEVANLLKSSDQEGYFEQVKDTASWVAELEQSSERISINSSLRRLEGIIVGKEGQPSAIAILTEKGQANRPLVYRAVFAAAKKSGVTPSSVHVGGLVAEQAWVETEGILAPLRIAPACGAICLLVCCLVLRSLVMGFLITWLSLLCAMSSVTLFLIVGVPIDAVTSTLPTLGILLTASLSLHWYGYYQREQEKPVAKAVRNANRQSYLPAGLAIMTTCCGMLSLTMSQTSVIRDFGIFGAAIATISGFWALGILPWVVRSLEIQPQPERDLTFRFWQKLSDQIQRWRGPVIALAFAVIAVAMAGLFKIETSVRLDGFFRAEHPAIKDAQWLETNIGPLSQMEIVLHCSWSGDNPEKRLDAKKRLLEELKLVRDVEQAVRAERKDATTFSAYHFVPPIPRAKGMQQMMARQEYAHQLLGQANRLEELGVLHRNDSGKGNRWRISFLTSTLGANELCTRRELAAKLRSAALTTVADREELEANVEITGIPLLMETIEQQFLFDLTVSYLSAILFIFLAIWIGLRSFFVAVLAMFPNTFPPLFVLGMLGWMQIDLDVGSIMTASIALGIAVDDTVHVLVGVKRAMKAGHSSLDAVRVALQHSGNAIVRTSLLGAATLIVLSFASFTPTARFGTLIAGMLVAALVGDLILLPALTMTKLGRKITKRSFAQPRSN